MLSGPWRLPVSNLQVLNMPEDRTRRNGHTPYTISVYAEADGRMHWTWTRQNADEVDILGYDHVNDFDGARGISRSLGDGSKYVSWPELFKLAMEAGGWWPREDAS